VLLSTSLLGEEEERGGEGRGLRRLDIDNKPKLLRGGSVRKGKKASQGGGEGDMEGSKRQPMLSSEKRGKQVIEGKEGVGEGTLQF